MNRRKTDRDAIVNATIDAVLAIVTPFVANQWGGDVVLRDIRRLCGTPVVQTEAP